MHTVRFCLTALLLLTVHPLSAGEPHRAVGKNPKNPPLPPLPPPVLAPELNRFGILGTGGFGVEAEFVSDAFIKKDPKKKLPSDAYRSTEEDDFSGGVELFYERILTDPLAGSFWGLRVGVGYTQIEIEETMQEPTNAFSLAHELDADLFHLNVGPFYEHRFTDQFYAQFSAGLTAAYIDADLSTRDSTGVLDADASEDDFLFGAYASLALGYYFTPRWSLMGGVRYQYLDSFEINNGSTEAELDFDSSVFAFIGLRYDF